MKVCLSCGAKFNCADWKCPACSALPRFIDGYPAFSPQLSQINEGFNETLFGQLAALEKMHFWFRSRNRLIIWALHKYFPDSINLLEIGCGTGFVLSGIREAFPRLSLSGSEIHSMGLKYATDRANNIELFQMDARNIPFESEFDVIGAFDVLEHIKEDELVLSQIYKALRDGGGVLMTVPQHGFLWSKVDEHACHVRRYNVVDIKKKMIRTGFEIIRTTSFMSLLLPLMMIQRYKIQSSHEKFLGTDELKIHPTINFIFENIMAIERLMLRLGVNFSFGGSLLLIARKTYHANSF